MGALRRVGRIEVAAPGPFRNTGPGVALIPVSDAVFALRLPVISFFPSSASPRAAR
jgi:hypothetical protein